MQHVWVSSGEIHVLYFRIVPLQLWPDQLASRQQCTYLPNVLKFKFAVAIAYTRCSTKWSVSWMAAYHLEKIWDQSYAGAVFPVDRGEGGGLSRNLSKHTVCIRMVHGLSTCTYSINRVVLIGRRQQNGESQFPNESHYLQQCSRNRM
jgi:hypothetical protein